MGGCISNTNHQTRKKLPKNPQQTQRLLPQIAQIPQSQTISVSQLQPTIMYPYYQSSCTQIKGKQEQLYFQVGELMRKMGVDGANLGYFIAKDMRDRDRDRDRDRVEGKRSGGIGEVGVGKVGEFEEKVCIAVPLIQSLVLGPSNIQRIQITPQLQYLILQKPNITFSTPQKHPQNLNTYVTSVYQIQMQQNNEYKIKLLDAEQIRKVVKQNEKCRQIVLEKNCIINGIIFRDENQGMRMKNGDGDGIGEKKGFNQLLEIFGEKQQYLYPSDRILCYINPQITSKLPKNSPQTLQKSPQYSTYLQLKSHLETTNKDIDNLFKPSHILNSPKCQPICIYILLFCLKIVMFHQVEKYQVPVLFLEEFFRIRGRGTECMLLRRVVNVMRFYFGVGVFHDESYFAMRKEEIVLNCCRNILQISSVNTHILIDAYLIQFGIEIDEKICQNRQNPLYQPSQPIKYRFNIFEKTDYSIMNSIKQLSYQMEAKIIQIITSQKIVDSKIENLVIIFKSWEEKTTTLHKHYFGQARPGLKINELERSQDINLHRLSYNTNQKIILQQLLIIRIYKFICQFHLATADKSKIRIIKKSWLEILDSFATKSAYNFCSGQLAMTVLVFDSLLKMIDDSNFEGAEQSLNKAVDIWLRMYRDPRAKYKPYLPNCWITFMIKVLAEVKIKMDPNTYSSQNIFHLHNIVECLYSNQDMPQYGYPTQIEWIFYNLPIRSISGIMYSRSDLLAPMPDDCQIFLMKESGFSLIDNQNSDFSSKSNYSQSASNTGSSFSRTRKKNKNRIFSSSKLSNQVAQKNGVFIWGKGVSSTPLLYPFAKNLDVLKIACGNYHTVLATTIGIFGWGQNGSGQLGDSLPKQNVKTINIVLQKLISKSSDIEISCGNEHTGILLKDDALVMFGQTEGGITAGNGHKFDQISCGGLHTLGIRNGQVYSWGRGEGGQLGHKAHQLKTKVKQESTDFYLDHPKKIQNIPLIKKSVCGDAHSVLLTFDGDVYVFGFSYQGQLGLGITGDSEVFQVFQPVKLEFKKKDIKIADIYAGSTFSFFKTVDGEIYTCGLNDCNQLGIQKMMKIFHKKKYLGQQKKSDRKMGEVQFSRPNKIQIFNSQIKVQSIYCGQNHCLASVEYMKKNKMVMGWGLNKQYQISSQFLPESLTPRTIDNLDDFNFSNLCCGSNFSVGLIRNENVIGLKELEMRIQQVLRNSINLSYHL